MKNLTLTLIISIFILSTTVSCKKSNAINNGGFSCKVNGQLWEPYIDDFKLQPTECTFTKSNTSIFIKAKNTKKKENFAILVSTPGKVISVGKYLLNSNIFLIGNYDKPNGDFITGDGYEGEIEIIKIDSSTKKMTGKFFFNCYDKQTKESVSVTEGEFNLRYSEY